MQNKKNKFTNADLRIKFRQVVLTIASFLCVCGAASAQTKDRQENDGDEPVKTEVKVGFSNISALELQKDKTIFYTDIIPTFSANVEKNGFYGDFSAAELLIANNTDLKTLNNKCLIEIGKYFGPNTKLFLKSGRDVTELGTVFLNGVQNLKYDTEKNLSIFGNLSERVVLGVQANGTMIELGMIGGYGQGFFIIPNPNHADFWAKVSQSFTADGWKFVLATATEIGNTNKLFASATATNGQIGITGGGNYNFDTKAFNAFVRGAYTTLDNNMTYVVQGLKKDETYSVMIGVGKNGVQGFIGVDNITPTQTDTPEFTSTPTVSAGISYNFGKNKTL